jgi:hypothetical protein
MNAACCEGHDRNDGGLPTGVWQVRALQVLRMQHLAVQQQQPLCSSYNSHADDFAVPLMLQAAQSGAF